MKFKDIEHQKNYIQFINKANIHDKDVERKSLFYLLAMFEETRKHINSLYDFKENWIIPSSLNQAWQTSSTRACTKLAFNLYNSFVGLTDEEASDYSIINVMAYAGSDLNKEVFLEAIKIRFDMAKGEDTFFDPEESIEEKLTKMGFKKS